MREPPQVPIADPVFTDAYRRARQSTRDSAMANVVAMAQGFRERNRFDDQHVVRVEFPVWVWETLSEDDRLELANDHNIQAVPHRRGDG